MGEKLKNPDAKIAKTIFSWIIDRSNIHIMDEKDYNYFLDHDFFKDLDMDSLNFVELIARLEDENHGFAMDHIPFDEATNLTTIRKCTRYIKNN